MGERLFVRCVASVVQGNCLKYAGVCGDYRRMT